ncbi:MAG: lactonase family protein [Gemmataceae bacterium]|nr:lactonase family protein [Gemmataceae bacterium]
MRGILLSFAVVWAAGPLPASDTPIDIYIGTYAKGAGQGIHRLELDRKSGTLRSLGVVTEAVNPSFLALSPDRRFLFSVSEVSGGPGVAAYAIDAQGGLQFLNRQPVGGNGPCHVAVDPSGKLLLVANYGGGSINALPIDSDGRLKKPAAFVQHPRPGTRVVASRQEGPHAHSVTVDPAGKHVIVADLGLDTLFSYRIDPAAGTLPKAGEVVVGPGTGPRHFAFHPNGELAFSINELSSTLTCFRYDVRSGKLTPLGQVTTLPADFRGENHTAEVRVHPNGRWVYASNRGHDSIVQLSVDPKSGAMTVVGHTPTGGKTPRNFNLDPSGRFLIAANQNSETVIAFRIDPETGRLSPTGSTVSVPSPVCVLFRQTDS